MSNIKQTNIRHYVMSALQTLYQWKDFLGCAERMLSMCQLKVKVTVKGKILNKQILDIMFCLLCKSYTNGEKKSLILAQLPMCRFKVKVTIEGQLLA